MTTRGPAKMFTHILEPLFGWWDERSLQKTAQIVLDEDDQLLAGSLMSIGSDGMYRKGLICGAPGVFAFNGSADHDAGSEYPGSAVGPGNDGVALSGKNILGLPCVGSFEIETTEFDADVEYAPMDPLTGPAPGEANAGKVTKGVYYENTICGIVTDGVVENKYKIEALRFWTWFVPPVSPCPTSSSN